MATRELPSGRRRVWGLEQQRVQAGTVEKGVSTYQKADLPLTHCRFKWGRFLPRDTGLPWWLWWERICLQCTKPRFDAWTGKIPWRRAWQPTPVSLPGKSHGQRSLGWLQSTGSQRVGHNWATNISSLGNKPTHVSRKNSERLTGPKFIKEH